jgi:NADH-quinone oxidoreductase subunit L
MALVQTDIKKVLAYSTISQLGYMMLALGTGLYALHGFSSGMFHLLNHAIFKALLFLCAGSVIHAVATNEMTKMGGLSRKMRITSFAMLLGSLSIAGFPFFSGFFSKDMILESAWEAAHANSLFYVIFAMAVLTAFMTAFYMFRMWFMTFSGKPKSPEAEHAHEAPAVMTVPLIILAVLAVVSGYVLFYGWTGFMEPPGAMHIMAAGETASPTLISMFSSWLTWLSIAIGLLGILLAYAFYCRGIASPSVFTAGRGRRAVHRMLVRKYGMDDLFTGVAVKAGYGLSLVADWFDRNVIDGVVNGISRGTVKASRAGRKLQTGLVQNYATVIVAGICSLLFLIYTLKYLGVI